MMNLYLTDPSLEGSEWGSALIQCLVFCNDPINLPDVAALKDVIRLHGVKARRCSARGARVCSGAVGWPSSGPLQLAVGRSVRQACRLS